MSSDEWEYEYDPHETEDLYFTLDLTTHVPDALVQKTPSALGAPKPKRAPKATPVSAEDGDEVDDNESDDEETTKLQVLDLHTPNPLVKFDEAVYSCYWTTDLGTQFHISQAGQSTSPLRKGTVLDVLGISRARLLGRPVVLADRNAPNNQAAAPLKAPSPEVADDEYAEPSATSSGILQIDKSLLRTAKSQGQASFLERFAAIKQRKGEQDQVPILAVKQYQAPESEQVETIKRKALDDDRNNALATADGKKRRRRRRMWSGPEAKTAVTKRKLGLSDGLELVDQAEVRQGMFGAGARADVNDGMGYSPDPQDGLGGERFDDEDLAEASEPTTSPAVSRQPVDPRAGHGEYLSYQTRDDYRDSVRVEEDSPYTLMQPTRPPWLPQAALESDAEEPVD